MNPCVVFALYTLFSVNTGQIIRGIYINPYQASKKDYMDKVFARADSGLINTIVVDFKSDYGFLCYPSEIELAKKIGAIEKYLDLDYLIRNAAIHNVKLVARVVCYHDQYLAQYKNYGIMDDQGKIWLDKKGIAWLNPYVEGVNDYLLSVVDEITRLGINSIAFDYIRFPTDGDIGKIRLANVNGPRHQPLMSFLKRVKKKCDVEVGICIFGYAVWFDLKLEGQDIAKLGEYVDIVYPMLYPSHFHADFKKEANEYWRNYWIYFDSVKEAFKKLPPYVKVAPFIQGFTLHAQNFGADYICSQINGSLDADANGFIIWNARSDYSPSWLPLSLVRNSILKKSAPMTQDIHMKEGGRQDQDINLP